MLALSQPPESLTPIRCGLAPLADSHPLRTPTRCGIPPAADSTQAALRAVVAACAAVTGARCFLAAAVCCIDAPRALHLAGWPSGEMKGGMVVDKARAAGAVKAGGSPAALAKGGTGGASLAPGLLEQMEDGFAQAQAGCE